MSWTIRRVAADDIAAVLDLERQIPEAPHWQRSDYERCLSDGDAGVLLRVGFVVEAENGLLGFSVGKLVAGICELESMAVSPEFQGQGIGLALLEAVADWAQTNAATRLELEVRVSNARAIKLYGRAGLVREGLRAAYYQSPEEDAVLMGKALLTGGKLP